MASINNIPTYLQARSPKRLRQLMLQNNIRSGWIFKYDIIFASGVWYAWYYSDAKTQIANIESGTKTDVSTGLADE